MCNALHEDAQPIPESGEGYKIFEIHPDGFGTLQCDGYRFSSIAWNVWDPACNCDNRYHPDKYGFCFFLDLNEARALFERWKEVIKYNFQINKIEYSRGLGTHLDNNITHVESYQIALCREFRILEKVQ